MYGCAALGLLAGLLATAQARQASPAAGTAIDVAKLGPQVGQRIPAFALTDQNGKTWTNQTIMGPRGAMLVFFRSADW
jgi:cytochrome oxidase Cu insertion factor (SCO1/SenC/PrrC family)